LLYSGGYNSYTCYEAMASCKSWGEYFQDRLMT